MNTVEIAFLLENHKKALSSVLASSSPTSFSSASTRKKTVVASKKLWMLVYFCTQPLLAQKMVKMVVVAG